MILSKEEKKERLRKGIESEATSDAQKQSMREFLAELEAPEPEPIPEPIKKKPVDLSYLPHAKYMAENNIEFKSLPAEIRKKINGLRMFMGKDSERVRAKAPEISNAITEMIKTHLTPPIPEKEYTPEEKLNLLESYKKRRARKKQKQF